VCEKPKIFDLIEHIKVPKHRAKHGVYHRDADALQTVLALVRAGTLARAGMHLGVDSSTVFRNIAQIERGLGQALFVRSRSGFAANEIAQQLAVHAERMEAELETARAAVNAEDAAATGTVRITTTDTLLRGLLLPALRGLAAEQPLLRFELIASNEAASLTKRDADIALRATKKPPEHLVGRNLGMVEAAVYAHKKMPGLAKLRKDLGVWAADGFRFKPPRNRYRLSIPPAPIATAIGL
jgi:DNA-binding transcriptional LysR family regulator